jgi:hypothetical protein
MSNQFPILSDLPKPDQSEIARIQAISSGQRSTGEQNYLTARTAYLTNRISRYDEDGNILEFSGNTVPADGLSGFAKGAIFIKRDAAGGADGTYENIGTTSSCQFQQTGGGSSFLITVARDGTGDYNCDGTADEEQINQAIQTVHAAGGGTIFLKPGTYNVTSTGLNLTSVSNIIFRGAGWSTVIKPATNGRLLVSKSANIKLCDFKVDCTAQSAGTFADSQQGITMTSAQNVEATGIYIDAMSFGFYVVSADTSTVGGTDTENIWIHHNYIRGRCRNDLIGGGPQTDTSFNFRNLIVESNYVIHDTSLLGGGTYYNAIDVVACRRMIFRNNVLEGSLLLGNEREPHEKTIVEGNIVRPVRNGGTIAATIFVEDANSSSTTSDILIKSNILYGGAIKIAGTSSQKVARATVADNTIINDAALTNGGHLSITQNAIWLRYASKCIVSNNNCYGPSVNSTAIILDESSDCKVSDNFTDGYARILNESGATTGNYYSNNHGINYSVVGTVNITGSCYNNVGINPIKQHDQGNVSGATTFTRVNGDVITATLTGNITVTFANGLIKGDRLTLKLAQDGTGSRTASWPANFKKAGGSLTLSTGAGAVDVIDAVWDGTNWNEVSRALNLS